ncbi:MAG: cytochrome C [Xanthomonadaceae bacterium]|nr:cytochrome C [Xanthomonadaceae bacterium]MDE2224905.1 cytochrome C [Xanthomonadaceae bacterium]
MSKPHVRVYLDDEQAPVIDRELPTSLTLDTRKLADGPHRLIIRAENQQGVEGIEEIPFNVQNGPGIMVGGLRPGSTRRGTLNLTVDAFSADDPFDPRRAEARRAIPTWVWVLCLFVVAWVVFYVATMWGVPAKYQHSPTFGAVPAASAPATQAAQNP